MTISIVIITIDQVDYLKRTFAILAKQQTQHNIEVIVVDSSADNNTQKLCKEYGHEVVKISNKNFNYARAFNLGFKRSIGEIVVRLSGDVIPMREDYIEELLWGLGDDSVAASYGKYICLNPNKRLPFSWPNKRFGTEKQIYRESTKSLLFDIILNPKKFERMRSLAGGAFAIKRKYIEVRPLNENVLEGEDSEYALYLHHIGLGIAYNPAAIVLHEHSYRKITLKLMAKFLKIWFVLLREMLRTRYGYSTPKNN